MDIKKKDKKQLLKIFWLSVSVIVLVFVFIVASINNAKNPVLSDASSLIKEKNITDNINKTVNNEQNDEQSDENLDNAEDKIKQSIEQQNLEKKNLDPFYSQILEQLGRQRYLGKNDIGNNYYPKDNYIKNAADTSGKISIFKKSPILIYVPRGEYYDPITQAFVAYNNQFKGLLSFKATSSPEKSDIKIILTNNLSDDNDGKNLLGVGAPRKYDKDGNILYSELKILNTDVFNKNEKPTLISVYNTALHEIGHCIGIKGHSSKDQNDVMYEHAGRDDKTLIRGFSSRDIETIKLMYSGREDLISKALENVKDEKLSENLKYAQTHNSSDSYLKVADSYYDMGQYDKALDAYRKALQLNPDNYRIYMSLAYCYQKAKQYDNVVTFGKYAIEKAKTNEQKAKSNAVVAYALSAKKEYESADIYYKSALDLNPNEKNYLFSYIINCKRIDKKNDAKAAYEKYEKNYNINDFTEDEKVIIQWLKS